MTTAYLHCSSNNLLQYLYLTWICVPNCKLMPSFTWTCSIRPIIFLKNKTKKYNSGPRYYDKHVFDVPIVCFFFSSKANSLDFATLTFTHFVNFSKTNVKLFENVFQQLFSQLEVLEYKELTLSANLAKADLDRYRWNYSDKPQRPELNAPLPDNLLTPMAIKTYLLTVKPR